MLGEAWLTIRLLCLIQNKLPIAFFVLSTGTFPGTIQSSYLQLSGKASLTWLPVLQRNCRAEKLYPLMVRLSTSPHIWLLSFYSQPVFSGLPLISSPKRAANEPNYGG